MKQSNDLRQKGMLVRLTMGWLGGFRTVKEVGREVADHFRVTDPSRVSGKVNVYATPELLAVKKHQANVRNWSKDLTLVWGNNWSFLHNATFDRWVDLIERERDSNEKLRDVAIESVIEVRERDRIVLGDLFNEAWYPTREQMVGAYTFNYDFGVLPDPEHDVRVGASPDQVERIKENLRQQERQQMVAAATEATGRVIDVLERVSDRCAAYKGGREGSFHDTLITNVQEIAGLLGGFNVFDDPDLDDIRNRLVSDLAAVDPEALRALDDDGAALRTKTGKAAQSILGDAKDVLGRIGNLGKGISL